MLEILAKRPDGRATFAELFQEIKEVENQDISRRFSELHGVDALQTGLVVQESGGIRITEQGRSVLRALEAIGNTSTEPSGQPQPLERIDELIDLELRKRIFDLDLRIPGESPSFESSYDEADVKPEELTQELHLEGQSAPLPDDGSGEPADAGEHASIGETDIPAVFPDAPSFLKRDFDKPEAIAPAAPRSTHRSASIVSNLKRLSSILRGHLEQDAPIVRRGARGGRTPGLLLAVLVLLVIVICVGAFIATTQIKSLKSQISTLARQIVPLKEQAASLEQEKRTASDQKSSLAAANKGKAAPSSLTLSADEVRLIREYIKPAPYSGPPARAISVGDPVTIATIPLPSPLTVKIPKLVGGRFTIHNGAIIILRQNSHQADVVLGSN
jgi:hypothetical protein